METVQQVISGVYTLLRRPSELKLHPDDVKDLLNDDLRGRVQDMDLVGREQRTRTREVSVDYADIDYRICLASVPDLEPVKLEYSPPAYTGTELWGEVQLINQRVWANHYTWSDRVVGAFYGSLNCPEGIALKLNLDPAAVGQYRWRLTYREPLLRIVQEGERPPIPTNFMPMVKTAVALKAMGVIEDDSQDWLTWSQRTMPLYTADLLRWEERWRIYLDTSVESPTQPMKPYNWFRRAVHRSTRGYLPRQ